MVLWASAFVAIRSAGGHFAPGALALGRLLVASLALGVVWLLSGAGWPTRAAWPGILGSGLLWFGLYMVTLNWGERDVDAGTAAMLVNIGPILLALLGGWLLHEGFPRRLAAGMAVSFCGVLVVGISESDGGRTSVSGVVLCLVAAVCYAAGVVGQKLALRHASAVQVTVFGCFTGTAACLPFTGQFLSQLGSAPVSTTLQVVYLGLFPTTRVGQRQGVQVHRPAARGPHPGDLPVAAVDQDGLALPVARLEDLSLPPDQDRFASILGGREVRHLQAGRQRSEPDGRPGSVDDQRPILG